jgi:hypothetical protein
VGGPFKPDFGLSGAVRLRDNARLQLLELSVPRIGVKARFLSRSFLNAAMNGRSSTVELTRTGVFAPHSSVRATQECQCLRMAESKDLVLALF